MVERRELLIGLGCTAALATAEFLRPRRLLTLMPSGRKLSDLVPRTLPGFSEGGSGDVVIPRTEGTLNARLYSDELARIYHPPGHRDEAVMMLIAYGPAQTDLLQLHRPEVCYPALGFEVSGNRSLTLAGGSAGTIPAVALTATSGNRIEDVIYWTRIGTDLPRDFHEQTWDRLRQSVEGVIGDGTLVRASAIRGDSGPQFDKVARFLEALVAAMPVDARPVLIGR